MALLEKIRLGDLLLQQNIITQDQLAFALDQQKRSGRRLGRVLVDNLFVSEEHISEALAKQFDIPYINLKNYHLNLELVRLLPESQARRFRAIVLEDREGVLLIGMADPTDQSFLDEISAIVERKIDVAVVTEGQLLQSIDRGYRRSEVVSELTRELREIPGEVHIEFGTSDDSVGVNEVPVTKLLQTTFDNAMRLRASDIHIEPQDAKLAIRFRIDGALHPQLQADPKIASALMSRLKRMSGMDASESRLPQEGSFHIRVRDLTVLVRISILPTRYGETVVMRLLSQSGGLIPLDDLGMPEDMRERFREIIRRNHGMVLVTGPVDSGKTTTLYAALAELNSDERKIVAVENSVEYSLPGINQVQTNAQIGLTYPRALHSVLQQDSDVILIGEMSDTETAQIGLRAALAGYLVFSTLHTCDAANTLFRLVDMDSPRFMVASSVHAVIAQRLLRRVCKHCSELHVPTPQESEWLKTEGVPLNQWGGLLHGRGCTQCNGTGYHGRMGVFEMLEMDRELIEAAAHDSPTHFMQMARQHMRDKTLLDHALAQMQLGQTTVAEVMRISSQVED